MKKLKHREVKTLPKLPQPVEWDLNVSREVTETILCTTTCVLMFVCVLPLPVTNVVLGRLIRLSE